MPHPPFPKFLIHSSRPYRRNPVRLTRTPLTPCNLFASLPDAAIMAGLDSAVEILMASCIGKSLQNTGSYSAILPVLRTLSIPILQTKLRKIVMLDYKAIYGRYESCLNAKSSGDLAHILSIARQTTNDWKNGKSKVPWWRLKELVDSQGISWDWLIDGKGEKYHTGSKRRSKSCSTKEINNRYLSLLPSGLTQAQIAKRCEVSQVTVHKWLHGDEQVSWKKLEKAVRRGATWDWLLEGE